jgi:uncharacterized membrane protein
MNRLTKLIPSLLIPLAFACGSDNEEESKTSSTIAFSEVNTILTNRCAGTECHSSGSSQKVYVDGEAQLKTQKSSVISRVNTKKDMPPTNATETQRAMTDTERTTIENFLNQ